MSGNISEKNRLTQPAGMGPRDLPVDAVRGFSQIAVCSGRPTGVPADIPGQVPMIVDILNRELYIYVDGWVSMSQDFFTEVRKGNIPGHSIIHKFGKNDAVPDGTFEGILQVAAQFNFLEAGTTVRIKAGGNAADDAGGVGARSVHILGLDSNGLETSEVLATNGINASLSTTTVFCRVYRTHVHSVGSYGVANTDDIIIENTAGTIDLIIILAGEGQSQYGSYSTPSDKTGYLLSVHVHVDGKKPADVIVYIRENFNIVAAPMEPKKLKYSFDGILGNDGHEGKAPMLILPSWTDIWLEARGSGAQTEVAIDFEILLVDN
ncbi:hypothetical protein LCGC14_1718360 [marine sediment metagenome]|uniref:Uncharacterized protein n=1 Tax=marine sediment metagenome TaxID=412755 RepID=A0A0F9HCY1_9ZZZZ